MSAKKIHALVRVILWEGDEAITFIPMGWASADSNLWVGACAIRISPNNAIVRLATGRIALAELDKVHADSYVVRIDLE